jgi:dipeptide/tripeptide permease
LAIAALVLWIITACAGLYLLVGILSDGGLRRQGTKVTRYPSVVVLGHPTLALFALGIWVVFLTTAQVAYAWGAFGVLVIVAFLGFVLLTRWLTGRGGRHARGAQSFPRVAVLAHGMVAIITFVLVLLTALTFARH